MNMGAAINSVLTSQINALMGNLKNASFSFGIEGHDDAEAGGNEPTIASVIRTGSLTIVSVSL